MPRTFGYRLRTINSAQIHTLPVPRTDALNFPYHLRFGGGGFRFLRSNVETIQYKTGEEPGPPLSGSIRRIVILRNFNDEYGQYGRVETLFDPSLIRRFLTLLLTYPYIFSTIRRAYTREFYSRNIDTVVVVVGVGRELYSRPDTDWILSRTALGIPRAQRGYAWSKTTLFSVISVFCYPSPLT